jgi:predicted alpha/beta superfamily hydrolase
MNTDLQQIKHLKRRSYCLHSMSKTMKNSEIYPIVYLWHTNDYQSKEQLVSQNSVKICNKTRYVFCEEVTA